MRCKECNVDLGENVDVCPLCHAKAVQENPVLEGIRVAEYPDYGELRPLKYYIKKNDVYFGKYVMWAVLALSAAVLLISFLTSRLLLGAYTILPAIYSVAALTYFLTSIISKKNGVRSAIYLITLAIFSLIIVAMGYITTHETSTTFYALGSTLLSLLGLMILSGKYPKEMDSELSARFHH